MRTIIAIALLVTLAACTNPPAADSPPTTPTKEAVASARLTPAPAGRRVASFDCNKVDCVGIDIVIQPNPGGAVVIGGCRVFEAAATPPSGSQECDSFYNTANHWTCYFNGTDWVKSSDDVTVCT